MDIAVPDSKNYFQLLNDLVECLSIIRQNILLYDDGAIYSYKVVAGQLRILLCDIINKSKSNNSLILKIFPNFKLHPLSFTLDDVKKRSKGGRILFFCPGTSTTNSNRIFDIFDVKAKPISLEKWLNQNIIDEDITIYKLIRSVADKDGGAHIDKKLDTVLRKTMSGKTNEIEDNKIYIIEIGRYVVETTSKYLLKYIEILRDELNKRINI